MKILILNWRDPRHSWAGGGEVYLFELAKRWVKLGNQVTLFAGQNVYEKLPEEEIIDGIRIIRKGGRFSVYAWAAWYYVKKLSKECDIIVDVQNGIPFFSMLYSRKPKVSVVYHIHGKQFYIELPFPLSSMGFYLEKFIFPFFYKRLPMITISKTTKRELVKIGFHPKNITIVYCGMKKIKNGSGKYKKFTKPTILYLGRIKKYKRVDMLIKLMPEILKKVPNAQLFIAGWGTEGAMITNMSMLSKFRKRIQVVGPVLEEEKRKLLARSWVFVNPSIHEGWGISVMEANMYGTPAIAFAVPGLSESIRDDITGVLVKSENEMVRKITAILRNKTKRNYLGKHAYAWANSFSWDSAAKESLGVMTNLLKG